MTRGSPNRKAGALLLSAVSVGERDPLKGWARKDTTLPDPLSIEQTGVNVTGLGLQLVQMRKSAVAA